MKVKTKRNMLSFDLWSKWLLALFLLLQTSEADKCETCSTIVRKFKAGLDSTAKSNFGGGNTAWEERKLSTYAFSETRLVEILDKVSEGDKEESMMVEEHEELIEEWWFHTYAKNLDSDLFEFLCINKVNVCCPNGTYGSDCNECPGGKIRPCTDNGDCRGDGTRKGSGKCKCHDGYMGSLCDECAEKYYEESKNDTHILCKACDESCEDTCGGVGPKGCDDCGKGWTASEQDGCVDVDECSDGNSMCDANEYCVNNPGSFTCSACNEACMGCLGSGVSRCMLCNEKFYKDEDTCKPCHKACLAGCTDGTALSCGACAPGWTQTDDGCQDVDECKNEVPACTANEHCVNTIGSFTCSTCHSACDGCTDAGADRCIRCKLGYQLDEENMCKDVDECKNEVPACTANEHCVNTIGSFTCSTCHSACDGCTDAGADRCIRCKLGYQLDEENMCKDEDECLRTGAAAVCGGDQERCANSVGSFACKCLSGYTRTKLNKCVLTKKGKKKMSQRREEVAAAEAEKDGTGEDGEEGMGQREEDVKEAEFSPEEEMVLMEGEVKPKSRKDLPYVKPVDVNDEL